MSSFASTAARAAPGGIAVALALAAVYIVWGSTYLGIRFALEGGWPPLLMAGGRFVIAGTLMFAVLRLRGEAAPTRAQWGSLAVMGLMLMLMGLGNGLVTVAEQWVSSGLAAISVASMPLWMGLFATLRGERPQREEWLGLVIGFVGVLWLNAGSALSATPQGLLALLIAPIAWAFGSVWSRGRDLPSPFMSAAGQMLCGGGLMLITGVLLGERMPASPSLKGTLAVAYLVVFGSIVAFSAYIWLLRHVRPALASSYAYVNPPVAVLFGALLAGERFSLHALGAMAVILAGVVMVTLARSRQRPPAVEPATEPAA
ncbi:drug/metabolite exporter YedA [Lysobacter maris]|uniref:Drug/metabolite exporter YedA n=1 Tax=Marilutibacter maris TaxID=1605891 RepID=A0A508AZK5_9GAMM|nr:drug/metabolite exporter YedA [Lysobacter maris]KAB8198272.1 drug/metabolite exporter YedA [Lysobacter maris]